MRARRYALAAFALPFLVYLLPHRYHGSGDTVPAELLPVTLLREGNFDFNEFLPPGADLPYYFHDAGGRVISMYPILPGLLNVPVYAAAMAFGKHIYRGRIRLSLITSSLIGALSALFLFLALRRLCESDRQAFGFTCVYAFATTAWTVGGVSLFQHGPSLLFLCAAIWALVQPREALTPLAGLFLGFAVANRPTNIVFAAPLAVCFWIHHRRAFARFAALAAIPAALLAVYSKLVWGSLLSLGQGLAVGGFHGNVAAGLAGLLVSPSRGLFFYSPVLIFGAVYGTGMLLSRGSPRLVGWLMGSVVVLLLLYSGWPMWWGGHCWAYRLITETVPALVLALALCWQRWIRHRTWRKALFGALLGLSILVQTVGIWGYPNSFDDNIDEETSRLWNFRESPLTLGVGKILFKHGMLRREPLVHHVRPDRGPLAERDRLFHVWWTRTLDDDSIPGWYDSPTPGERVTGPLTVDGWARSRGGDVEVAVVLDGGARVVTHCERYPRPDACLFFPLLGDCSHAGWRTVLEPPSDLPATHEITIELRAPTGHIKLIGPVEFTWSR